MKRHLFLVFMIALAGTAHAQLVVDSLGRVSVGAGEESQSQLHIFNTANMYGLNVYNRSGSNYRNSKSCCIYGLTLYGSKCSFGIHGRAFGGVIDSTSYAVGVCGQGGCSPNCIGVMGMRDIGGYSLKKNYAGIYGTTDANIVPARLFQYPGEYAGYFDGNVLVTKKILGQVFSLTAKHSASSGIAVQSMTDDMGEDVSARLLTVRTVKFVCDEENCDIASSCAQAVSGEVGLDVSGQNSVASEASAESVMHYGLDGEQLKAVFPELVVEDSQGNYRINYSEMVPLLLQSIRELSARVEELEGNKGAIVQKSKAKSMSIESEDVGTDIVRMSQNTPNPFSESSVIALNVPEDTKSASIYVYDLSGKLVKSIPVGQRGETDITVYASDLREGMFVYSLVVDGTVAATRRMMVVKN